MVTVVDVGHRRDVYRRLPLFDCSQMPCLIRSGVVRLGGQLRDRRGVRRPWRSAGVRSCRPERPVAHTRRTTRRAGCTDCTSETQIAHDAPVAHSARSTGRSTDPPARRSDLETVGCQPSAALSALAEEDQPATELHLRLPRRPQ